MEIQKQNTFGKYAVIFTSKQTSNLAGYSEAVNLLRNKLSDFPGFIGLESVEDKLGNEITISYWENADAIKRWKTDADHKTIREENKEKWYADFKVRIAIIEREYEMKDTFRK